MLDGDGVGIGVEIGLRLKLRDPAAKNLVGDRELPGFVVELDDDVFAEVLERNLRAEPGAEVPDLVGPLLEFGVVRDAALERDRFVFRAARRFAAAAGIAAFAVLDDFGRALERADFADARDIFAVPFDAELEVLVGIEALRVDAELSHGFLLSLSFYLAGHLLDFDDDEFGRLERREADHDVDDAAD